MSTRYTFIDFTHRVVRIDVIRETNARGGRAVVRDLRNGLV